MAHSAAGPDNLLSAPAFVALSELCDRRYGRGKAAFICAGRGPTSNGARHASAVGVGPVMPLSFGIGNQIRQRHALFPLKNTSAMNSVTLFG